MAQRGKRSAQARRRVAPLVPGDEKFQTVGCRHTNPEICGKNGMRGVCAFVNANGICYSPPARWAKQYDRLVVLERSTKP